MTPRVTATALLGLVGWLLSGTPAAAQDVATVRVSQAYARLPEVVAFLDVLDADENPAQAPDQVTATMQDQDLVLDELVAFEQSGEGVAYVFLVDISQSLRRQQFDQIRSAIEHWISGLNDTDRAAILSFGDNVQVVHDFTSDQEALRTALQGLGPTDLNTQFHLALSRALEVGRRQDPDLPTRRVIVILSDGKDEGSGLTEEDVVGMLHEDPLPIYAIGYSRLSRAERRRYLDVLHRFVQLSGGIFSEGTDESLDEVYDRIRQAIRRVWLARFTCSTCRADGRIHPLLVTAEDSGKVFPANLNVRALPGQRPSVEPEVEEPAATFKDRWLWWILIAAGVAMLALLGWFFWSRRQPEWEEPEEEIAAEAPALPREIEPEPPGVEPAADEAVEPAVGVRTLRLIVVRGRTPGQSYDVELRQRCVVGTEPGNDLVLEEEGLEPHHFELYPEGRGLWIRDLTRQRKTSVNGVPIAGPFQLERGDLILAGRTEMRVVFEES